jgi:hypothetical protein
MLRASEQIGPERRRFRRAAFGALAVLTASLVTVAVHDTGAAADASQTMDLRVLVLDDDSAWVNAIQSQMDVEGIPYTAFPISSAPRPTLNPDLLFNGSHAFFQAVVAPNFAVSVTPDELATLHAFEAQFGVREVDGFNSPSPSIGLDQAAFIGDPVGLTGQVTPAGLASGFSYLNGPVPIGVGSYAYVSEPLSATSTPPMPSDASFTTLVSVPVPGASTAGSLVGVYASGGVEQMVITAAMNFYQPHFKLLAHGIVSWMTRGVHLGYNRNRFTMHVDDAFSAINTWDAEHKCTPGEDCPIDPATGESIYPPITVRMTPDDVAYAAQWSANSDYKMTLAFNAAYSSAEDPLTQALVADKSSFNWLNHGFEHLFQGCLQDFAVVPWTCQTDPATGAPLYVDQVTIANEIQQNIATGQALGLPFDPSEYLSGEHSGLYILPQMPVDNPNFVAAVQQAGLKTIGADASREAAARVVGGALTLPRHPTIIYYNAATAAQEVSEYNWFYTSRDIGGSGYCDDNPTVATCGAPLGADGFLSTMVPNDAAFDMIFILGNDPRPFYAHTSNLAGERVLYPLLDTILGTYRAAFSPNAPLLNQTMTQASRDLSLQGAWAASGMAPTPTVTASVNGGTITISNSGGAPVPITVPAGSSVAGVQLEPYGGELSGWLAPAPSTTVSLPGAPTITLGGSADFRVGQDGQLTIASTGTPAPTIAFTGDLPDGLEFTADGLGRATISGAATTPGDYPITLSASNASGEATAAVTLRVGQAPSFTSATTAGGVVGAALAFKVTTTGSPVASITAAGRLPTGVTFTAAADGTATLAGTPSSSTAGVYPLTLAATNWAGAVTQDFTLTITSSAPVFTSAAGATTATGQAFTFQVTTTGAPPASLTRTGSLPRGVTFTANADGTAAIAGTPTSPGTYRIVLTAKNIAGTARQTFVLTVGAAAVITSANTANFTVGRSNSFAIRATGSPKPTISIAGALPSGVRATGGANGSAKLSGRPAANSAGSYPLTITATSSAGTTTQSFTLVVGQAPRFTSDKRIQAQSRKAFSFTVTTTGSPAAAITLTGALPSGVTFKANSNGTATISGTPTRSGVYLVTLTATNTAGSALQLLVITVR